MLDLTIKPKEFYDEESNTFFVPECVAKDVHLRLEHSLVSISKWESFWKKPFLTKEKKSYEEIIYYVKCMTLTQNVNPEVYNYLSVDDINKVNSYIEDPMSATTINENRTYHVNREQPTSELIYYWMIALNIPMECQKWHLNQLMTLIKVASIEQQPPKQMSKRDIMAQNKSLNAARRARMHSKG